MLFACLFWGSFRGRGHLLLTTDSFISEIAIAISKSRNLNLYS